MEGVCVFRVIEGKMFFFFLSEGKRVIIILKPQTSTHLSFVDRFSPIAVVESLSQSPRIPRKLM